MTFNLYYMFLIHEQIAYYQKSKENVVSHKLSDSNQGAYIFKAYIDAPFCLNHSNHVLFLKYLLADCLTTISSRTILSSNIVELKNVLWNSSGSVQIDGPHRLQCNLNILSILVNTLTANDYTLFLHPTWLKWHPIFARPVISWISTANLKRWNIVMHHNYFSNIEDSIHCRWVLNFKSTTERVFATAVSSKTRALVNVNIARICIMLSKVGCRFEQYWLKYSLRWLPDSSVLPTTK